MLTQFQVIIEIVLSFFLLMGIIYSFFLSRMLSSLKRDRASLLALVEKLESSVHSAEEGIEKLRIAGEVSGRPLSRMIEQARITGSELDTMVDKAGSKADRLEELVTKMPSHEKQLEKLLEKAEEIRSDLIRDMAAVRTVQDQAAALIAEARNGIGGAPPPGDKPAPPTTLPVEVEKVPVAPKQTAALPAPPVAVVAPGLDGNLANDAKIQASSPGRRRRRQLQRLETTFLARPIP